MNLHHASDSLLLYDPNRSRATTNVWIARPTPDEEQRLGKLFMLITIDTHQRVNHDIIGIIQDEVRVQYYQGQGLSPERQFEHALTHTNQRLNDLIADGVNQWVNQAHILLGVVHHQRFMLAPVRSVHAFLLHNSRLVDVVGEPDLSPPNPLRFFSETISGYVSPQDQLLFCLPSLLDYFSLEKLRRTLLDNDPHEAVRLLEQHVLGVDPSVSFGALVFSFQEAFEASQAAQATDYTNAPRPVHIPGAPVSSMNSLIRQEKETAQLLAPSVWPAIRNGAASVTDVLRRTFRTAILRKPPRRVVLTPTEPIMTPADDVEIPTPPVRRIRRPSALSNVMQTIRTGASSVSDAVQSLIPRRQPRVRFRLPSMSPSTGIRWWRSLSLRQQQLAGAALLILVILSGTLFASSRKQTTTQSDGADIVATVQNHIDQAQSALLYGGESTARVELQSAAEGIATLPKKTKQQQQVRDELLAKVQSLVDRVAKKTPAISVVLGSAEANEQPQQLYLTGTTLTAYAPATQSVTVFKTPSSTTEHHALTVDIGDPQIGATTIGNTILFSTDRQSFVEYDPKTDTWTSLTATLNRQASLKSLTMFQQRLYALDSTAGTITRATRSPRSVGAFSNWLKETPNLSSAKQIVVDGSIFILQDATTVTNYFSGKKTTFALPAVTPGISDITRIWTNEDAKYLYLLEASQRRIIVVTKEGAFVRQYSADTWTDAKDLAINEKDKFGYILNGSSIERFPLTDLTF